MSYNLIILKELNEKKARLYNIYTLKMCTSTCSPFSLCQEVGKIDIRMEARLQKGEANDYKRKQQNGKAMPNIELLHVLK